MHIRKLLSVIALLLTTVSVWSQDIHFTQYNMAPMSLNPANIGKFEGTARIGGIFRGQWASVLGAGQQFRTPSVWVDAPVVRGFRKRDWVGVGLMIFTDKAGALGLTHSGLKFGGAYHLGLDKKANNLLSFGLHLGGEQRRLDPGERAQFGDGFKSNGDYDQGQSHDIASPKTKASYSDYDAGVIFTSRLNKRMDFSIGYSMFHITKPKYSINPKQNKTSKPQPGKGDAKLPQRSVAFGTFNLKLDDRFTVSPSFIFQTMSGADEIAIQAIAGYLFDPEKDITLKFGAGYRLRDALEVHLGYKKKDLTVGIAYDINTSQLSNQTNFRGGFEIAANYIIKKYKKPNPKAKILCPRF
ncbi:MAG: PorP/SprF family type IX secretion system membrane protein [Bacteroidota bacterium]